MLQQPRALFFDLDATLLVDDALEQATRRTVEELVRELPHLGAREVAAENGAAFHAYFPEVETEWTQGRLSSHAVVVEVWRRTLLRFGVVEPELLSRVADRFSAHARDSHRLFEDALPLLEALQGRFPLALITNAASDLQREKLEVTGIGALFDCILISGEVGFAKPDRRIFEAAAKALDAAPSQAWHIGDNLSADVAGAQAAGVTGVWINRKGSERPAEAVVPDLEIGALAELEGLLGLSS